MTEPVPIHNIKKIGKCTIKSYLSADEIHIVYNDASESDQLMIFKKETELEQFFEAFNKLVLLAKISNTLNKQNNGEDNSIQGR